MEDNKEIILKSQDQLQEFTKCIVSNLASKDWIEYQVQVNSLTCAKALEGTQVSKFRRIDEPMLKTIIHLMVEDVFAAFGASEKVALPEIIRITSKILTSYWWLKIEELAYVFNKGKQFHYGKVYPIPTEANFLDWLNKYDMQERDAQCIANARDQKDQGKAINKLNDDAMTKLYSQTAKYKNIGDDELRNNDRFKDERIREELQNEQFKKMREQYFKERNLNLPADGDTTDQTTT